MKTTRGSARLAAIATALVLVTAMSPVAAASAPTDVPGFVLAWGSLGSGDGQFASVFGVAADSAGNVYVVDAGNGRIEKFDSAGTFLTKWAFLVTPEFNGPFGIATDSAGNVYVTDSLQGRIEKYSTTGTFLTTWGSPGTGDGQFANPRGLAIDGADNVYVADTGNNRVQKFNSTGTFLAKWGSLGPGDGQFANPRGVTSDSAGNIYVSDTGNVRIEKFDSSGTFLAKWGSTGSGDGQFTFPFGIATDSGDNVYVVDNNRVQKFNSTGTYLAKWGSLGSATGQFVNPQSVAIDGADNIFVGDTGNNRIEEFAYAAVSGFNVASATSTGTTSVAVTFDALPTSAQATTLANYSIPGLTLSGTPTLSANTVTITTSTQAAQSYTVTVSNVTRASDAVPLTTNSVSFSGTGGSGGTGGSDTGTVAADVTVPSAALCLQLSTSAVSFGTLALGTEDAPATPGVVVTNCGDAGEELFASGTDATGTNAAWTLVGSSATCADTLGTDAYHLGLATPAGVPIVGLAAGIQDVGPLAAAGSVTHVPHIWTACPGSSGAGTTMSMQINYLATAP